MKQPLQVFANRAAVAAQPQSTYRNFLIIDPEAAKKHPYSPPSQEEVKALARHLSQDGYAYVARSSQKEMEDDPSGVRYLPLRGHLPFFALMTAVIVIGDPELAAQAASTYPDADIFLMQPA
ncbi:hypothetical protein [Prosthecobacter sp.]|uniref:hypothetical protein n=1 Tax=Prosthecobacter sp. TaxID=1965333 RepID=UPI00378348D1